MSAQLVTIGDRQIWVEESGSGSAIVFIHGLGGTCNVFDPQTDALSDSYRVIAFDLTGHGMSPLTASTSVMGWAEDVVALLDHLEVASATLVAHSLGTLVAQAVISSVPERVDGAVLLGPIRDLPDAARQAQHDRAATVRSEGMVAVAHAISRGAVSGAVLSEQPVVVAFIKELLQRQSAEGYAAACEALGESVPADVSQFGGAVLAVTGGDDGVSPSANIANFAAEFADAETEVIDAIGHWTSLEAADRVTALVRGFLERS